MKNLILISISSFFIFSCGKDVDIEGPDLQFFDFSHPLVTASVCGIDDPNSFRLRGEETFGFTAIFRDNNALSQYKIDIHNNFDCHGHNGALTPGFSAPNLSMKTETWNVQRIGTLNGTEHIQNFLLEIPKNITAGNYHFSLQVLDKSGNEQENRRFFNLNILNPLDIIPPSIENIIIEGVFQNTIKRGATLKVKGLVKDNKNLGEGGNGVVFISYKDDKSGNSFATNAFHAFRDEDGNEYDFELNFTIPQTLSEGFYTFYLKAFDGVRNESPDFIYQIKVEK